MLAYWRRVIAFALGGALPRSADDVPVWALTVPFTLWNAVVRHDGRTFAELYTPGLSAAARRLLPLRALYLAFLFAWPWVALVRSLGRGRAWRPYLHHALTFPELAVFHPKADYSAREVAWSRPDFSIGMFYAWVMHRSRAGYLRLDDKRYFLDVCERAGLPLPPTYTASEAIALGGDFIAKDPQRDLGFGVTAVTGDELAAVREPDRFIIQRRLRNHPTLRAIFGDEAPLSSFRVITTLDPETREPAVTRCAVRIGRADTDADNTAQGGIWARVDLDTGVILAGVTKKTFGVYKGGAPVLFGEHPDTGRSFVGVRVPWFDEGRAMALDAHRRIAPEAITLGWDIALTEESPVFLEVNVWTTCYDYDPPNDARAPACAWIVRGLRAGVSPAAQGLRDRGMTSPGERDYAPPDR